MVGGEPVATKNTRGHKKCNGETSTSYVMLFEKRALRFRSEDMNSCVFLCFSWPSQASVFLHIDAVSPIRHPNTLHRNANVFRPHQPKRIRFISPVHDTGAHADFSRHRTGLADRVYARIELYAFNLGAAWTSFTSSQNWRIQAEEWGQRNLFVHRACLLYTSDAADE